MNRPRISESFDLLLLARAPIALILIMIALSCVLGSGGHGRATS